MLMSQELVYRLEQLQKLIKFIYIFSFFIIIFLDKESMWAGKRGKERGGKKMGRQGRES